MDAGIGFDAITVALLGRSRPWGVFIAGLLFGALKAGGYTIQAANDIPIDIVLVVQSLIVLFVAAPPLVRAIFRLPTPGERSPETAAPSSRRRWRPSEHRPPPVIPDSSPIVLEKAEIRSWKAPIAFGVFVVISLILFFGFARHGQSSFRFTETARRGQAARAHGRHLPTTTIVVTILLAAR